MKSELTRIEDMTAWEMAAIECAVKKDKSIHPESAAKLLDKLQRATALRITYTPAPSWLSEENIKALKA